MNKKTKMYVGLGVVAVAAYYFWHKSQADKTAPAIAAPAKTSFAAADAIFANAGGTCDRNGRPNWTVRTNSNGVLVCSSPDGMQSYRVSK